MSGFSVNLGQLDSLRAQLEDFTAEVHGQVAMRGVAAMAKVPYDAARMYAPISAKAHIFYGKNSRRTGVTYSFHPGNLRAAIYRAFSPEKSTDTHKEYRVSWNHIKAPYGHMVEFGTSRAPAHPFLGLALSSIPDAVASGKAEMGTALIEITRHA